ncbi:MAG: nicotinate phosphoribosyltransferase [Pseudomonadota bacterium]
MINLSDILFTDLYQLTMGQVYFREGLAETSSHFEHYFREYPDYGNHQAGFCVSAGMGSLLNWMDSARFNKSVLRSLQEIRDPVGKTLFSQDFLSHLDQIGGFDSLSIRSVPEGRIVHRNTPMTVVEGPMIAAQLLETALLAKLNYQTLIATRAARIRHAGRSQLVLDFGMRRGQDTGANAGSRAALIGGADYSSNVGVSQYLGIEPRGTHAHSMVQVFLALGMEEIDAFRAYARSYPDQCLLLVDTVDTLNSGVPNAIRVFEELKRKGHRPVGIRLDSGDLAYLSIQSAKMLDAAGFDNAGIALSNNLDELAIWQIITQIEQEASRYGIDADNLIKRLSFGVGTRMITSEGDSSLGGVYKLVAVEQGGQWRPAMKLSESASKTPSPGKKKLTRLYDQRGFAAVDLVSTEEEEIDVSKDNTVHHPVEAGKSRVLKAGAISQSEDLHVDVFKDGTSLIGQEPLDVLRARRVADLESLDPGVMRLVNPHIYHVSLSDKLWNLRSELIADLRGRRPDG